MKKRISSMVMAFVMVFTMAAAALPVRAESPLSAYAMGNTSLTIEADKTEVKAGDVVTYTITLGPVRNMLSLKFKLNFQDGLTYVEGSGKTVDGLADTMNAALVEYTESTSILIFGGKEPYTSFKSTPLMTLQCTVDDGVSGNLTLSFDKDAHESFADDDSAIPCKLTNAHVEVKAPSGEHEHQFSKEWYRDSEYHWHRCECGEKSAVAKHSYNNWIVVKAPTENEEGLRERTCKVCGYKQAEKIPALGGGCSDDSCSGGGSTVIVPGNFTDVKQSDYFYDAVQWAVKNNVTSGTSATTFGPNVVCTRAQAVTFLWRAAGSPANKVSVNPFTDVKSGDYFYDAVLWAVENGITSGTSATTFGSNDQCSRAQIMTFLWRSQKSPNAENARNPFTDVADNAYYANAVLWAVENGITSGTSATTFGPNDRCTRAQIVTFLYQCMGK